jgi:hypothetical protein
LDRNQAERVASEFVPKFATKYWLLKVRNRLPANINTVRSQSYNKVTVLQDYSSRMAIHNNAMRLPIQEPAWWKELFCYQI